MMRIVQANRQATHRQIKAQYSSGVQNGISDRTARRSLSQMGYCRRFLQRHADGSQDLA